MTIREAHRHGSQILREAGVASPGVDAWWLLEAATGASRTALLVTSSRVLSPDEEARFLDMLARRAAREPVQHIVGETSFYGVRLRVDPRALIPRPETERLVELALERLRGIDRPNILDVGTGSGAIALALKVERPDANVLAIDVSEDALALARENAGRLGLEVRFVASDVLSAPAARTFARHADAIVANLPYLPDEDAVRPSPEVARDPAAALYAGAEGLDVVTRLIDQAATLVATGTWLLLELDPRNVHTASERAGRWTGVEIAADLTGRERFLMLRR